MLDAQSFMGSSPPSSHVPVFLLRGNYKCLESRRIFEMRFQTQEECESKSAACLGCSGQRVV